MVMISLTLDDLDTVVKALDSADFYSDNSTFYEHLDHFKYRLERLMKKYETIQKIDEKIKWNHTLLRLGRGFETIDDYEKAQEILYKRKDEFMKERSDRIG